MAPRKFSGPIQRGAIRVLQDRGVASTSDIMPITHPRQHNPQHRSRSLRRVLDEIAERVGRDGGQGARSDGGSRTSFGNEVLRCYVRAVCRGELQKCSYVGFPSIV